MAVSIYNRAHDVHTFDWFAHLCASTASKSKLFFFEWYSKSKLPKAICIIVVNFVANYQTEMFQLLLHFRATFQRKNKFQNVKKIIT